MWNKTLIYLVPVLSCLHFPLLPFFVSGIPLTHHFSSHLCLLPPVLPYLSSSVLTLLSFQPLTMFFFLYMSVLIHLSPSALCCSGLCGCSDTNKLCGHCFGFDSHSPVSLSVLTQFFSLPLSLATFRQESVQCKLRWTQRQLNTHLVYTSASFINCAVCPAERQFR